MTTARALVRSPRCQVWCTSAVLYPVHHDRLLDVDVDPDAQLELLEIAVSWHELDYSTEPVVGPSEWLTFAARHRWTATERAVRVFSLAVDIVGRSTAGLVAPDLAEVLELVRT
jgi:hypothetical protein